MRRPLNWFVVAISLAFLVIGRSLPTSRASNPMPIQTQVMPFEASSRMAVPAALRRERNLEFGYVKIDPTAH